jgi:hypothetical protein
VDVKWENVPFTVNYNSVPVLSIYLTGKNEYRDVELQFPRGYQVTGQTPLTFSTNGNNAKWAIAYFAIVYENAPLGTIYYPNRNTYGNVILSYFTPLLTQVYHQAFPGYRTQPLWLEKCIAGNFNAAIDIICINGQVMQIPTAEAENHLQGGGSSASSGYNNLLQYILQLIGKGMDYSDFTCGCKQGVTRINGNYALGPFASQDILTRYLTPLPTTQTIAVRFRLYLVGEWDNTPFMVNYNGAPVLTTYLTGNNRYRDIELQFSYAPQAPNGRHVLTFGQFGAGSKGPQWSFSDFAIVYSNAPTGQIYYPQSGTYTNVPLSYYTLLLNNVYEGSFPKYKAQPIWLQKTLAGTFTNDFDIICVNGKILNLGGNNGYTYSSNGYTIIFDLLGDTLANYNLWSCDACKLNTYTLKGGKGLGLFGSGVTLMRSYPNLGQYASVGVRFRLYMVNLDGENFWVKANGQTVYQTTLTGGDNYKDIEFRFDNTQPTCVLTLGTTGKSTGEESGWAFSDFGFLASKCGANSFFNTHYDTCQYAGNSIFYAIVKINLQGADFPGLLNQPKWLPVLRLDDYNDDMGYYYVNGQTIKVDTTPATPQVLQAISGKKGNTVLLNLVDQNFDTQPWTYSKGRFGTTTLNGYPVLGGFACGTNLAGTFNNLGLHSSVTLRFRLYLVGWTGEGFSVTANGVKVYSTTFNYQNDWKDIELQFDNSDNNIQLVFSTTKGNNNNNAAWYLSDFGLYANPCAVQNVFNFLLSQCVAAGKTIMYSLVRCDYYGQFYVSGSQPRWLNKMQGEYGHEDDGHEIYYIFQGDTGTTKPASRGYTLIELTGQDFGHKGWTVRNTREQPYTSDYDGTTIYGPYEAKTVLRRTFTVDEPHATITLRFRLYKIGAWLEQSFWVGSAGGRVFEYTLGGTDNYEDLEITFDHTDKNINLVMGSSSTSGKGEREGLQYGISDFAMYVNPCQQKNFFNLLTNGCQPNEGHSTFYNLVTVNGAQTFKSGTIPVWKSKMNTPNGVTDDGRETYSFLKGNQMEIIRGVNGTPEFIDIDLIQRLKDLIETPVVEGGNEADSFKFLAGLSSTNIVGDYENRTFSSYAEGYNNLFGAKFTEAKVSQFEFSFDIIKGWACVGVTEEENVDQTLLHKKIREESIVICSDDAQNLNTQFRVQIDPKKKQVLFDDVNFKNTKIFKYKDTNNLRYTVQFYGKGTVQFGENIEYYNFKTSNLRSTN